MTGVVSLVGAGCGGRDLLTLGALDCIRSAQALVYDDLLDGDILDLAGEQAELHYVGLRSGRDSASQVGINALLVRLGGDRLGLARLFQDALDDAGFGQSGGQFDPLRLRQLAQLDHSLHMQ